MDKCKPIICDQSDRWIVSWNIKSRIMKINEYGGDFVCMVILHYMKTTYGWTPAPVLDYNYMHHMTTFLFDVDVDKLERLVNGKSVESDDDKNDNIMTFKLI